MALSKAEIAEIAKATALEVLAGRVTYHPPETVTQGLMDSRGEEILANQFYLLRAKHARSTGDEVTAKLYEHIAKEEFSHYQELGERLVDLF